MSNPQSISPPVREFLARHIRSVDDLALLIALVDTPERWWDATTVAHELGINQRSATIMLEHLARHDLLDIRITGDVRYQFAPTSHALREDALACAAAYRTDPLPLLRAVNMSRGRSALDFADAFRIRRNDNG